MTCKQIISFLPVFLGFFAFNCISSQSDTIQNGYYSKIATSEVNKKRRNLMLSLGGATYSIGSYALYKTWYEDFPRSSFHFYDDSREWRAMDKAGHMFSSYSQSKLCYLGWKWVGQSENTAIWSGFACSMIFQTTIEVMDGFSQQWGFSWTDMGSNVIGAGLFVAQQRGWGEQRILLKNSASLQNYDNLDVGHMSSVIDRRVRDLYGTGYAQRWLKDYNGQTIWLSANLRSFLPNSNIPQWLNLSIGYGAQNMLGGYTNQWVDDNDQLIKIDEDTFPRYSQFYLSLDADLSKIKTDSPFVRTLLDILNVIKMPFSAIEINTRGEVKFYLLHF